MVKSDNQYAGGVRADRARALQAYIELLAAGPLSLNGLPDSYSLFGTVQQIIIKDGSVRHVPATLKLDTVSAEAIVRLQETGKLPRDKTPYPLGLNVRVLSNAVRGCKDIADAVGEEGSLVGFAVESWISRYGTPEVNTSAPGIAAKAS